MYNKITYGILQKLVSSGGYVTAQELAESLNVSRRTILNYMKEVKQVALEQRFVLFSKPSRGYSLEISDAQIKNLELSDKGYYKLYDKERELYVAEQLLSEEGPIRVSELQDILFLSRPSIYKLLHKLKEQFESFEIKLIFSKEGVYLSGGEKRFRRAFCFIN